MTRSGREPVPASPRRWSARPPSASARFAFTRGLLSRDRSDSAKRIGKAITQALKTIISETRLLVENTAGAWKTMEKTAYEIKEILDAVPGQLRARTGYGLDTCHLFASGYDITASRQAFTDILDE